MQQVSVIGLGYIGLPTASVIASKGMQVLGIDINKRIVETINQGKVHIYEPDLDSLVYKVVESKKLKASTKIEPADVFIIAVPTPFKNNYEPDLSHVESAIQSIAPVLSKGNLLILESTSPVGTTELIVKWLAKLRPDLLLPNINSKDADINIAYCPERVLPGKILHEIYFNTRIIGGISPHCAKRAADFYQNFIQGECLLTNSRTAEMCKLTENAFRDVNIGFANELSLICDNLNINVWELITLANRHPRVNILQPGPGVGGHCIAVDPWFIVNSCPSHSKLIRAAREVNDFKPHHVIEQVKGLILQNSNITIACFGLSFKADIDDLRESPAVEIVKTLAKENICHLLTVEPNITELPDDLKAINNIEKVDIQEAIERSNIILLLVNHRQFYEIDKRTLHNKNIIDTRGIWQ